jgi:hypothetical protein
MREATGIGEKAARAAVFLISLAGASNIPEEAAPEDPDTAQEPASRAAESPARVAAARSAVESSSGCGTAIFLAVVAPLIWLIL